MLCHGNVRVRLTKKLANRMDGVDVSPHRVGDILDLPVEQARLYDEQGADVLVFLDISATNEARKTTLDLVGRVAVGTNRSLGIAFRSQPQQDSTMFDFFLHRIPHTYPLYGSANTPTTGRSWEPLLSSWAVCLTRSIASWLGRNTESRTSKPSSRRAKPTGVQSLRHCTRRTARRVDRLCSQRECATSGSSGNEAMSPSRALVHLLCGSLPVS